MILLNLLDNLIVKEENLNDQNFFFIIELLERLKLKGNREREKSQEKKWKKNQREELKKEKKMLL